MVCDARGRKAGSVLRVYDSRCCYRVEKSNVKRFRERNIVKRLLISTRNREL